MRHHRGRFVGPPRTGVQAFSLIVAGTLVSGACGESPSAAPTAPSKDFKSEAKSAIDEKNMDAEMNKLKAEIEADSK
jgi:hypothetical protein